VRRLLESGGVRVVGEATGATEAAAVAVRLGVDVVVLGARGSRDELTASLRTLRRRAPAVASVVVGPPVESGSGDGLEPEHDPADAALFFGARSFVAEPADGGNLVQALGLTPRPSDA
jgi:DNA-binding NarL/FixJ family response regulator